LLLAGGYVSIALIFGLDGFKRQLQHRNPKGEIA
jgi:hypothetical protein